MISGSFTDQAVIPTQWDKVFYMQRQMLFPHERKTYTRFSAKTSAFGRGRAYVQCLFLPGSTPAQPPKYICCPRPLRCLSSSPEDANVQTVLSDVERMHKFASSRPATCVCCYIWLSRNGHERTSDSHVTTEVWAQSGVRCVSKEECLAHCFRYK